MKRILKVMSAVLFIGGLVIAIGTAGMSDCGMIEFQQMVSRMLTAMVIMLLGFLMLGCLDQRG